MLVQAQGTGFLSEILSPAWHQFGVFWNVLHAHAPHEKEELRMTFTFGQNSAGCYKKQWDEKLWHETLWTFSSLDSRSCECLEMRFLFYDSGNQSNNNI